MGSFLGGIPTLLKKLKKAGLDGITLTINSLNCRKYRQMTFATETQFNLMKKALKMISKLFKEETTLNIVVTKINFDSINKILKVSKKLNVKIKLLEMTNGREFQDLYIPFFIIKEKFKGDNIEYVNSCCPASNCNLCKKLYPVVRLSPDGKLNGCINNEKLWKNIIKFIKNRNETYIKEILFDCLYNKRGGKMGLKWS